MYLTQKSVVYVDLETTGLNPYCKKDRFAQESDRILLCVVDKTCYKWSENKDYLINWFNGYTGTVVGYNLKFDLNFLRAAGVEINFEVRDLYIAYSLLLAGYGPTFKRSLADALERIGVKMEKDVRETFINMQGDDFTDEQSKYALKDVEHLPALQMFLEDKLKAQGLWDIYLLENSVLPAYVEMEYRGIFLDDEMWIDALPKNTVELRRKVYKYITDQGYGIVDIESPKQLLSLLERLGIESKLRKKDSKTKTWEEKDSTEIKALTNYHGCHYDFVQELIALKKNIKLWTTYLHFDEYKGVDGRIHASFKQMGTATGRVSCTNPNLQNIPREAKFRNTFRAERGWIITADYSNCEMRILADLAGEETMLRAFERGDDIHSTMATMMFGVEVSKKVNKHLRDQQKGINFGVLYGAGATNLKTFFEDDYYAAEQALEKFHATFPKVKAYQENSKIEIVRFGYAETMMGRKRYFPELHRRFKLLSGGKCAKDFVLEMEKYRSDAEFMKLLAIAYREGTNHRIQGTNADMTKLATSKIYEFLKKERIGWLINQVHDEIVIETEAISEDLARSLQVEIERLMIESSVLKNCKMEVESELSKFWSK